MSIYPGNPALGDEVKQRIMVTYEQSLELAERGRREEALLGCDFVLELDPQFAPARALRDRLVGAATAAPALPDLEAEKVEDRPGSPPVPAGEAWSGSPPAADLPEESFEALFDLDALDLLDLDEQPAAPPLAAAVRERLEAPDYREALDRAGAEPEAIAADPEAARIAAAAQARLEAQPYVESFLKEAGTALRAGDGERARMMLDKARSLDPGHPLLADLDAAASAGEEAERSGTAEGADAAEGANAAEGVEGADAAEGAEPAEVLGGFELPEPLASEEAPLTAANPPAAAGGDGRIGELLAEGQGAADRGDYQGAIDSWSRIFLIDVDHEEAARRIEEARRSKAEREREVE
ncbi:MAG TPA: hypothetical protein VMR44_07905, partial [Thermoanaerobaculia bacterium]|nr:hypothetical protein [Thermoanaerobaculia bacterium]